MDTKALRQKILDLAIHGKLVPQDPNDEPASVLLERIRAEKERLIKEGKIKKGKKSAKTSDKPHYPFELPKGWVWCKLDDIVVFQGGYAYKSNTYVNQSMWQVIRIGNVKNDSLNLKIQPAFVDEKTGKETQKYQLHKDDILFTMTGTKGKRDYFYSVKVQTIEKKLLLNQRVGCLRLFTPYINVDFLCLSLKCQYILDAIFSTETGNVSQGNIGSESTLNLKIAIPPFAEQCRIVTEVNKWYMTIEQLEQEKDKLQSSIDQVKSKVLDLAIHGKLVSQDPNDEPASELLKRINPKAEIITDNGHYQKVVPFKLPNGWSWTTLGSITNYGSCTTSDVLQIPDSAWVLELEDIEKDSAKILSIHTKKDREIKGVRRSFKKGEILYSKLRTYLNKVLVASQDGFCTTEIIPISVSSVIDNIFLCHVLRSQYFLDYTSVCGYGVKMPRLSTKDAQNGLVPLPPRKEQLRIVSKIEELFHQLDIIEESL